MSAVQRLLAFFFLGAVNHQVTFILVASGIFAPMRAWVEKRNAWLGELVHCQLCTGTWVGLWMALAFRPGFVPVRGVPGWPVALNRIFCAITSFFADAFLVAFAGRWLNEVLAIFQREVKVKEETAELLDEMERETEREGQRA